MLKSITAGLEDMGIKSEKIIEIFTTFGREDALTMSKLSDALLEECFDGWDSFYYFCQCFSKKVLNFSRKKFDVVFLPLLSTLLLRNILELEF